MPLKPRRFRTAMVDRRACCNCKKKGMSLFYEEFARPKKRLYLCVDCIASFLEAIEITGGIDCGKLLPALLAYDSEGKPEIEAEVPGDRAESVGAVDPEEKGQDRNTQQPKGRRRG